MIKKTLLAALLTAPLLGSSIHPVQAATTFNDISNSYAKDAINKLVEAGILNGTGSGQFNPTGKISRQDFAVILAKGLQLDVESVSSNPTFSDVPTSHYAYKYVEAAAKAGLLKGIGSGQFGLGQNLSRQDMAVIFTRALGVDTQGYGQNLKFSDASKISDYAKDAVGFAVQFGLLNGTSSDRFDPSGIADRQSAALAASRLLQAPKPETPAPVTPQPTTPQPAVPQPTAPKPAPTTPVLIPIPPISEEPSTPAPVNEVPTNPSVPPINNGGGSTEPPVLDTQAPALTLVSSAPFKIGTDLTVRSSEVGIVYLVPAASEIPNKSALENVVLTGKGVKAAVITVNGEATLPTSQLTVGAYKAYAVDAGGNVSSPVTDIVLGYAFEGPQFELLTNKLFVASFPERLNTQFMPNAEDFTLTRTDGGMNQKLSQPEIEVKEKGIGFLSEPLVKGGTYEVAYTPSPNSQMLQSVSGKAYGPFVRSFTYTNIAPQRNQLLQNVTMSTDANLSLNVDLAFIDWDDTKLSYTAVSDNKAAVEASIEGNQLSLHAQSSLTTATITLTAQDSSGDTASQRFTVTVVNAASAIDAAEAATAKTQDLTSKSPERLAAEQKLADAQGIVANLTEGPTKTEYLGRLKNVKDMLDAVSQAEELVVTLEMATTDDKNMLDEDDRFAADTALETLQNSDFTPIMDTISFAQLKARAEKAASLMSGAEDFLFTLQSAKNTAQDGVSLLKTTIERTQIDSYLADVPTFKSTKATENYIKPQYDEFYKFLSDIDKSESLVNAFVQAVDAAADQSPGSPAWQQADAARAAITYANLNPGTYKVLKDREDAAAAKYPAP
ncbi:hypothetical protein B9G55_12835 [Saccharibacillus sp. O16]|nr:hypothetical protein B9G55_12835 [Saccharibacillus sp. O16]